MPPILKVGIPHNGMEIDVTLLQPNLKIKHGLLDEKIKQVGEISFRYGFNGGIRQIGNLHVEYDWNGHVKRITGNDERVELVLHSRNESKTHEARKPNHR